MPKAPRLVAIGSSAGGVEAMGRVLERLPGNFPAAILVVVHTRPRPESKLADVLGKRSALKVELAIENARLRPGHALVAPPDQHLVVRNGTVVLDRGARVNGHRPSIDVTFRSVAAEYGERAVSSDSRRPRRTKGDAP